MNTGEEGEKLINQAEWVLNREVVVAIEERNHNLAVRRAQEVVELALKGAVRVLGGEYPKVHDVAPAFCHLAKQRHGISGGSLDRISKISQRLSESRAPSFYIESEFSEKDAASACDDAQFVLTEVKTILELGR